jgi:cyclopropane fatty-acyl-phospholipid synthase-like methyltransferase
MGRKHEWIRWSRAVLLVCCLIGAVSAQAPHGHQHGFSGAEHWARVFDDPARDDWQKPEQVIAALGLAPDAAVADIGAGTGYFAVRLAQALPRGRVYAADIEADMVRYLGERAQRMKLANLVAVRAAADDARLPARVDRVLIVNTYHHVDARAAYFRRLAGSLKPDGEVAIIDFRKESPIGPPAASRLAATEVKAEMKEAGYALVAEHAFLPYQYFLVFRYRPQ